MKTIASFSSKLLALTLALMASVSSFAYDFQSGYLFYNILPDSTVAVTSEEYGAPYDYLPASLVIPSEVTGYNSETYIVTEIANYAFSGCDMLESCFIPNTVKKIGMYAFTGCSKLVDISFPESLEDILGGALYECAWYNNQPDGLIYAGNLLYRYKGTAPTGTIVVKDGTKAILDFTFFNQPNIQSVVLPESVTSIHLHAFKGCTNLTKLTLPSSVQIIENEAFADCTSLTEVTCYAPVPPIRGEVVSDSPSDWFFAGVDVAQIPLYIPAEAIELYKTAEQWMFFNPILPINTPSYKSQWCDTWNVMWFDGMRFDETASTSQYRLGKDTIIGDYTYSKFTSRTSVRFTSDRKVYVYYEGFDDNDPYTEDLPTGEYLAYDFSAQVGDTLEVFSGVGTYSTYPCVVDYVEIAPSPSVVDDAQTDSEPYLRIIKLHPLCDVDGEGNMEISSEVITWIEGVGSPNGFLISDLPCGWVGGGTSTLLCAYKGDELKYTGPLYEEYGCEYNANDVHNSYNAALIGQWRGVDRNLTISISDSIISIDKIGLSHKYIASATQLQIERLWALEDEPHRSANCDYWLRGDTLWIDSIVPSLAEIYPPMFGSITLVRVKNEDLFPTLWGLQRTSCTKTIGEDEEGTVWGSRSYLMQETQTTTIDGKQYMVFGDDQYNRFALREENNKILVYSSILKKDLVLYDFTLEVGDSLPALYFEERAHDTMQQWLYIGDVVDHNKDDDGTILPAETFVVTDISTITLLDGKEYKKWTFDNGMEYVEGIGSFGTSYAWNDFYQLIANGPLYSDVHSQHLVCVSKNGQLLYQMDDEEMERLVAECLCEVEKKWSDTWCDQWNILSHGYQGPQYPLVAAHTSIYWLSNNTVNRSGQEYIPLMCSSSMPNEESTLLVGELRFTEDKQVYFNYDNTEYLLYDFDVQVGDTLDIFGGIELYSYSFVEQKTYPHVITKIDTLDDGRLQITSDAIVIFEDSYGAFEEKMPQTWIEGLGSTNGIVYTSINPGIDGDAAIIMLCAYRDDECVYKTDSNDPYWIDYTQLGCVYNEGDFIEGAFPILSGLQRTVCNEYCGETEDDNSANNTYKQTFDSIFFENDKPYILCDGYLLREEDNKILIYSQSLNKDLVLYDFTLEVGDSLSALYINAPQWDPPQSDDITMVPPPYNGYIEYYNSYGTTESFFVTEVSSVTLLDGNVYKKWTFDNGMEYVEGIGMYGGHRNGNFFGLIQEIVVPCHTGTHLVCVSKNGKLLYQMDDAEMERLGAECLCDYDRGPRKDNAKNGKIGGRPTPTQWNMLEMVIKDDQQIMRAETFSYTLENDSIVANGKTFYYLARQSTKDTAITKSFVGALHFGEDEDNRVYFYHDGAEYVLYDFTAEPGDTLQLFAGINNYPQHTTYTHVVTGKDTIENGACRMMLEVVFPEENASVENAQKVWLAGLGSIDGIVHNAATQASASHAAPRRNASSETQTSVMLCAWREDSCLYTTNLPDYDTLGCVYNQDPTSVEHPHIPDSSHQKVIYKGQLLITHEGKVYNAMGIQIK